MFLALFVYSRFTQLGDTNRYLSGRTFGASNWWYSSTHMMDFLAHAFSKIVGPILANVPFVFLAVYGVYYSVERAGFTYNQKIKVLLFLSLPSFSIWSSIASKEAMAVFFMGVILGFLFEIINKVKITNKPLVILCIYLCVIFKPQYMIGLISIFTFVFLTRTVFKSAISKLFVFVMFLVVSFSVLYILRDIINDYSYIMPAHFRLEAGSTRVNDIWVNDYDVFRNAFYGMLIGFWGPTLSESIAKSTHFLASIESFIVVGTFLMLLVLTFLKFIKHKVINIMFISLVVISLSWILFVHYPFGALNPGSAIRYRTNFFSFLVVFIYFVYLKANSKLLNRGYFEKNTTHYYRPQ
ncbi:hypothetical protein M3898_003514 [Vibrio metschnikovii]|nr:hypothetical protein [Vibrio metschnikovii]